MSTAKKPSTKRTSPRAGKTGPLNTHFTAAESTAIRNGLTKKTPAALNAFAGALARLVSEATNVEPAEVSEIISNEGGGLGSGENQVGTTFTLATNEEELAGEIPALVKDLSALVEGEMEAGSAVVSAGKGAESADSASIEETISVIDFLTRLLVMLRNYEKNKEKESIHKALLEYVKNYAPDDQIRASFVKQINNSINPAFSDRRFSRGVLLFAIQVLRLAQSVDAENWFGTLDAQLYIHYSAGAFRPPQEKKETDETKKKEPEVIHFSILCSGSVPNKKTLDRFGFSEKQVKRAQVIFHSFFVLNSAVTQGKRITTALLRLQDDVAFLRNIIDSAGNDNWAIHFKEVNSTLATQETQTNTMDYYIDKSVLKSIELYVRRSILNLGVNQIRANKSTKVRSPLPLSAQPERSTGLVSATKPVVLLSPFLDWLAEENFPQTLFDSVTAAGEKAVGDKYDDVKQAAREVFGLPEGGSLLEMGLAVSTTVSDIFQIPLFLGGEDTISLTQGSGAKFDATEPLMKLLKSEVEYGVDAQNKVVRGQPTSILEVSNQAASAKFAKTVAEGGYVQRSQVRRSGGNIRGLDPNNMSMKDFAALAKRVAKPFVYLEGGMEVNEVDNNPDLFHLLNTNIMVGNRKVSTADMKIEGTDVTVGDIRKVLTAEMETVKAAKLKASKVKEGVQKELLEAREKAKERQ